MITSSRQARQMLGRLAGLKSARKQRGLGWPNLKRASAMRSLTCRFRRCADQTRLSATERDEEWRSLMALGVERASALDMLGWMKRYEPREKPVRLDLDAALARARFQAERIASEPAAEPREETWRELMNPERRLIRGIKPVDLRRRGMTLTQARRIGLI
jgi:hypothetical protein